MSVITVDNVRSICGIGSDAISDEDITYLITQAEEEVNKYLNTAITPKLKIDFKDTNLGDSSEQLLLTKHPLLRIVAIKVGGTSVSPKYVKVYPGGRIVLTSSAEETTFSDDNPQDNTIKYYYGYLEETSTETTLSSAIADGDEGDDTTINLTSSTGFSDGDWIKIEGTDGYREVTQIESVGTNTVVCDLSYPHESGSRVVKMDTPTLVKRFVGIITSLMMVARIVGQSYTDIVGYGLGDMSVQKGEPYTQWRETHLELEKEREQIIKILRPMPAMA